MQILPSTNDNSDIFKILFYSILKFLFFFLSSQFLLQNKLPFILPVHFINVNLKWDFLELLTYPNSCGCCCSIQLLSQIQLFVTPWTAAPQTFLPITNSWSLLKLMPIESVMPSNHLIFHRLLHLMPSVYPSSRVFSNESVLCIRQPSIGSSASALVLPINIQDWFPLGLTGLISLQSKGLLRVFSNTTLQKHQFLGAQLSL